MPCRDPRHNHSSQRAFWGRWRGLVAVPRHTTLCARCLGDRPRSCRPRTFIFVLDIEGVGVNIRNREKAILKCAKCGVFTQEQIGKDRKQGQSMAWDYQTCQENVLISEKKNGRRPICFGPANRQRKRLELKILSTDFYQTCNFFFFNK